PRARAGSAGITGESRAGVSGNSMRISKPGILMVSAAFITSGSPRFRRAELSQVPLLLRSVTKTPFPSKCSRRCSREMPVASSSSGLSGPRPSVTAPSRLTRALLWSPFFSDRAETSSSTSLHDLIEIVEQLPSHEGIVSQERYEIALLRVGGSDAEPSAGIVHQTAKATPQGLLRLARIGKVGLSYSQRIGIRTGGCRWRSPRTRRSR